MAAKRKPNAAFMKPVQPDSVLAEIVGAGVKPRKKIGRKIWAYVKRNGLQNRKNPRLINADDRLRCVFGGKKQVTMFEMTKLVNKHLK